MSTSNKDFKCCFCLYIKLEQYCLALFKDTRFTISPSTENSIWNILDEITKQEQYFHSSFNSLQNKWNSIL